jgi:hypothetical protein
MALVKDLQGHGLLDSLANSGVLKTLKALNIPEKVQLLDLNNALMDLPK